MAESRGLGDVYKRQVSRRTAGWEELAIDGISALQIHAPYQGSTEAEIELIESVRAVAGERQVWRAIDMTAPHGSALAAALADAVDLLILDSGTGGTGTPFDWTTVPDEVKAKSLLAGGLNPENLTQALRVGTAGLDINSGVEVNGRKDSALIAQAFHIIRHFTY